MIIRPCGLWIVENRLLTMRYNYGGRDRFNLPGGGQEGHEQVVETLHREFHEEIGVRIDVGDLLFTAETLVRNRLVVHLAFQVTKLYGTPQCHASMTSALEIVWLPIANLEPETLYPAIGPAIQTLFLHGRSHPVHLGRLDQPWYE
ncbi:MAG: NUDIX hydrolase [Magnetococcales bacterium]|nr:NUDIX hydrolase [Magnetococcales bacterium]HIJ84494.1 NUDIX domain-containing protein [Magnetococcales bacterium]